MRYLFHYNDSHKILIITTLGSFGSILLQEEGTSDTATTTPRESILSYSELQAKIESNRIDRSVGPITTIQFEYKSKYIVTYCSIYRGLDPQQIKDTTGAGDVFFGSLGYSIVNSNNNNNSTINSGKMLSLSTYIAAMKCRYSGITGIPTINEIPEEYR